ncbi:hypothetical protein Emag_006768 [Eimeria magna]
MRLLCRFPESHAQRVKVRISRLGLHKSMSEHKKANVMLSGSAGTNYNPPLYETSTPTTGELLLWIDLLRTTRVDTRNRSVEKNQEKDSAA